jgi:hypothetical protein
MRTKWSHPAVCSVVTAAMLVGVAVSANLAGCAQSTPEVDQAALYSPESLAQELSFRYRALNSKSKTTKTTKNAGALPDDGTRITKTGVDPKPETKKKTGSLTVDDLLEDIDSKVDKIDGLSRSEIYQKMIDTISKDQSLSASDKTALTDLVGQLANRS